MKRIILFAAVILTASACTSPLDKPLNKEDFAKIKEIVSADERYSAMKKKYITDNLALYLGFAELGKAMNVDASNLSTFREEIGNLSTDFDSISTAYLKIREDNEMLKNFIELTDARTVAVDEYHGYLGMTMKFNNRFDKDVLYAVVNYKYIDKYDNEFFNENVKLTDKVAENFKGGEVEISTTEEYNNVARFIYSKVPVRARKDLADKMGRDAANKKVQRDFLMEGLQVETVGVVFTDKTEVIARDADWEYLEQQHEGNQQTGS